MIIEFSALILLGLIFTYLAVIILINHKKGVKTNYKKEYLNLCIFISVLLIISQTIFPIRLGYKFEGFEIYNLIPFKAAFKIYRDNSFLYFLYQTIGNIVLFLPFGYFAYLKTNKNIRKTLTIAFLTTLTVEITQGFIPYRLFDIDDLLLNTLGAFIGMVICIILNKGFIKSKIEN